jgi:hypothetical protein
LQQIKGTAYTSGALYASMTEVQYFLRNIVRKQLQLSNASFPARYFIRFIEMLKADQKSCCK